MRVTASAVVAFTAFAGAAFAQPAINGATVNSRLWNDDPNSTFSSTVNYPTSVSFTDENFSGAGWANRHNWRMSGDGGTTAANFSNGDSFSFSADVTISGTGDAEAGLNLSPWWSQDFDGQFNMRTTDGEVAVFGGRLPFYSFTGSHGVNYVKGTTVNLGMVYTANSNTAGDPATIEYLYNDGTLYSSGSIAFDQGNPLEGFGEWGMLDFAQAGGYMTGFIQSGNDVTTTWGNINYIPTPASAALLGLGGLVATRRRRS
ncbi:MAG: hypothetical protein ACI89L_002063 [Phycisphaerales bacterium]|jgi:hypothetical protein